MEELNNIILCRRWNCSGWVQGLDPLRLSSKYANHLGYLRWKDLPFVCGRYTCTHVLKPAWVSQLVKLPPCHCSLDDKTSHPPTGIYSMMTLLAHSYSLLTLKISLAVTTISGTLHPSSSQMVLPQPSLFQSFLSNVIQTTATCSARGSHSSPATTGVFLC